MQSMYKTAGERRTTIQTNATFKRALLDLLPHMRAFARSLARNRTSADDLVQTTVLKALSNCASYRPGSNLRAWVFTILRNEFYSELRKRRREVEDVGGSHAARLSDAPPQDAVMDLLDMKAALARLPAQQREALSLIVGAECSYEEAAAICRCAVGTIKSRVNRGRAQLRDMLSGDARLAAQA